MILIETHIFETESKMPIYPVYSFSLFLVNYLWVLENSLRPNKWIGVEFIGKS